MLEILPWLLRRDPKPVEADDVVGWWRATQSVRDAFSRPIDEAIAGGFAADRLGYAFAGGYEAALRALIGDGGAPEGGMFPRGRIASFSVTEKGGNHPKAIEARLEHVASGDVRLDGEKRWATLGPVSEELFVTASFGEEHGRKRLRCVRVPARAPGVQMTQMPPAPFVPEVPHAAITFSNVVLPADALLPGDGYSGFVKPFRTVEDVHVHGATLGYLTSVARRHNFPQSAIEGLLAAVVAVRGIAEIAPTAVEGHIALAGILAESRALLDSLAPYWAAVDDNERERLHRDRVLLDVASTARKKRLERAWQVLAGGENS